MSANLLQFLTLGGFFRLLTVLVTAPGAALFLLVLALSLVSGIVVAATVVTVGLVCNLVASAAGGMVADLGTVHRQDAPGSLFGLARSPTVLLRGAQCRATVLPAYLARLSRHRSHLLPPIAGKSPVACG